MDNLKFSTWFLRVFSLVALSYTVLMVFFTSFVSETHWGVALNNSNDLALKALTLNIRGWGVTILALGFIAFFSSYESYHFQKIVNRGIFVYFAPLFILWLLYMLDVGFLTYILTLPTFGVIVAFVVFPAYFGFVGKGE